MKTRRHAWIEMLVMALIVLALGLWLHPADPLFVRARYQPLWIVVLLMAVRYGAGAGIGAGLFCAALHLVGFRLAAVDAARAWNLDIAAVVTPFLYVLAGIVVGGPVTHLLKKADFLGQTIKDFEERLRVSESNCAELEQSYRQLERRIAGQTQTVTALADNLRQLDAATRPDLFPVLRTILKEQLGVDQAGVWELGGDGRYHPAGPAAAPDAALPGLGAEALRVRGVVSARDLLQEGRPVRATDGLLAGPVVGRGEVVLAVVVIQRIPFVGLTEAAVLGFKTLLDWTSRALAHLEERAAAAAARPAALLEDLLPEATFRERVAMELQAATEDPDRPVTLLACRLRGAIADPVRERLVAALARIFRYQTHLSDSLAFFPAAQAFVLLLPVADLASAAGLQRRLAYHVDEFAFQPYGDAAPLRIAWAVAAARRDAAAAEQLEALLAAPGGEDA